jgi:hypothetical protein
MSRVVTTALPMSHLTPRTWGQVSYLVSSLSYVFVAASDVRIVRGHAGRVVPDGSHPPAAQSDRFEIAVSTWLMLLRCMQS